MDRKLGISEILEKASGEKKVADRVRILQENSTPILQHLLRLHYTPGVKWLLPPGSPPFNRNAIPGQEGNLYAEWRRFYLFFPREGDNLKPAARESIFIQILESIDPRDADLIISIKDGKMPYPGITRAVVDKAFPDLIVS